jgi:hypothetical protein
MAQWQPILEWLAPVLAPAEPAAAVEFNRPIVKPVRPMPTPPARPARPQALERPSTVHPRGGLLDWLPKLRFLQRKPTPKAFAGSAL